MVTMNPRILAAALPLLAAAATLAARPAQAAELWFSDDRAQLGRVDLDTVTSIGNMGTVMTDLAFSPSGVLYGTSFNQLFTIDTATGVATLVGSHFLSINALVFGTDGTLYGASSTLYTLDPLTGSADSVGGIGYTSSGDLAFVGGELYLSVTSGGDSLVQVDLATGDGTLVGGIGRSAVYGLATPNGNDLYGMSGTSVFGIDAVTGAAGPDVVSFAGEGFGTTYGTTFIEEALPPVPEPSTYALMAFGLAGLAWAARQRKPG